MSIQKRLRRMLAQELSASVRNYIKGHDCRYVDLRKGEMEVFVYQPDESYDEWTYSVLRIEKVYQTVAVGIVEQVDYHYKVSVSLKDLRLDTLASLCDSIKYV